MFQKLFSDEPNRPDLNALFDELNAAHFGGIIPKLELEWNTRTRTVAGTCHFRRSGFFVVPTRIEMSDALFAEHDYDIAMIRSTFIHELCHAYCAIQFNESGHGYYFNKMMTLITGVSGSHRCHNYDVSTLRNTRQTYVMCYCESCGKDIGKKKKMPAEKVLNRGFTHRGCGGRVTFRKVSANGESENRSIKLF